MTYFDQVNPIAFNTTMVPSIFSVDLEPAASLLAFQSTHHAMFPLSVPKHQSQPRVIAAGSTVVDWHGYGSDTFINFDQHCGT